MGGVWTQLQQVFLHAVRHGHKAAAALQEIPGEGLVKPVGLVGDYIVQNGYAFASGMPGHIAQRGCKPAHPVLHHQQVGSPFPDGPCGFHVGEGIHGVQQGIGLYRRGLVFRGYVLRFSGKQEIGVLPRKGEGPGIKSAFSQSLQQAGVELGNAAPKGVKTGQERDLHGKVYLFSLLLM